MLKRRNFLKTLVAGSIISSLNTACNNPEVDSKKNQLSYGEKPNVLFISIDDLNNWVGFLKKHPYVKTPNFDRLAARSLIFKHAYATAPICLGSRNSVMFGHSPFTHKMTGMIHQYGDHKNFVVKKGSPCDIENICLKEYQANNDSIIDNFYKEGYYTMLSGKIFHKNIYTRSLDEFHRVNIIKRAKLMNKDSSLVNVDRRMFKWSVVDDAKINEFSDFDVTQWSKKQLRKDFETPFFLAAGIHLPHIPWRTLEKYWDLYDEKTSILPADLPPKKDLDDLGWFASKKVIMKSSIHKRGAKAIRAYLASISFADDMVGQLIDELDRSKHKDNTIVVLWSDHGYHLGEKLHWHKFTLWEQACHVPFLIHYPKMFKPQSYEKPVSLLDIFPTLIDMVDIKTNAKLDGKSLLPQIADPELADQNPAITVWDHGNCAVRWKEWRYIRYLNNAKELYHLPSDPHEHDNLLYKREQALKEHLQTADKLDAMLPSLKELYAELPTALKKGKYSFLEKK